jgi:biotin carboxyl carrier protein
MQSTDIVPEFRRDLQIQRVAGGVQVVDPVTGTGHSLNEYEVSLARMLNGKRPVFEVIEASERLGIPINVESLQKFIGKLEMQGLLQPPESIDSAIDKAWPSRGQWESNVRTLFQSGIRFLRQGKHEEAIGYFEALLAEDPDNVEAKELLEMSKQATRAPVPTVVVPPPSGAISIPGYHMTPSGPVPVVPGTIPGAAPQYPSPPHGYPSQPQIDSAGYPAQRPQEFPQLPMGGAPGTSQQYQAQAYPPGYPQQVPGYPPQAPMPHPAKAPSVSKPLLIGGLVALVAIGGMLGFLFLKKGNQEPTAKVADGSAQTVGSAAAIGSGSAAAVTVDMGSGTKTVPAVGSGGSGTGSAAAAAGSGAAGSAAATPDTGSGSAKPDVGAGSATAPEAGSGKSPPEAGSGAGSAAPDETAPASASPVNAPTGGEVTAFLKGTRAVKKGEKLFSIVTISGDPAKIKELTGKVKEMETLAKSDPDTYKEFVATAKRDLAAVRKINTTVVTAPKAGKATPKIRSGATVRAGQVLATIQ